MFAEDVPTPADKVPVAGMLEEAEFTKEDLSVVGRESSVAQLLVAGIPTEAVRVIQGDLLVAAEVSADR